MSTAPKVFPEVVYVMSGGITINGDKIMMALSMRESSKLSGDEPTEYTRSDLVEARVREARDEGWLACVKFMKASNPFCIIEGLHVPGANQTE